MNHTLKLGLILLALMAVGACLSFSPGQTERATNQVDPKNSRLRPPGTRLVRVEVAGAAGVTLADQITWSGETLEALTRTHSQGLRFEANQVLSPARGAVPETHRFWLGSDSLGRDLLARMLQGTAALARDRPFGQL